MPEHLPAPAGAAMAAVGPPRVWSVPAAHAYVATAIGTDEAGLVVLPDPPAVDGATDRWWPSPAYRPDLLPPLLDGVDVLHVQFGFESASAAALEAVTAQLDAAGVALVVTVHDLANPHLEDQAEHLERLGVLVRAASAVITLTDLAAAEIHTRWGRHALVLPHPHVAPLERIGAPRPPRGTPPRVTLPLKSLRTNTLRADQLAQVAEAVTAAGARLHVDLHPQALDPDFPRYDPHLPGLLAAWRDQGAEVDLHDRVDDTTFLDKLAATDCYLLPYRHGTHSGVLEACLDVGTPVVAPTVGCYTGQHPCPTYAPDDIPGTLPAALARALHEPPPVADPADREAEAERVRAAHHHVYTQLTATRSAR